MKILVWAMVLICLLSFFQRDRFASDIQLDTRLFQEPLQQLQSLARK